MEIKNINGLSGEQIRKLVSQGGKFVMYRYCISVVFMTFNRNSNVYFIPPGKSGVTRGLGFLFTNLTLGWWGIPWGPIYTIGNIGRILMGGLVITDEIMAQINQSDPDYGNNNNYNIPGMNTNNDNSQNTYNINSGNSEQQDDNSGNTYNIPR